ncbi:hypothetical protein Ancab_032692 [Ancistrocladus abbreviatus]
MGGCCCCLSRRTEQYPRTSEEQEPLSLHGAASSSLSTGLLVDTNFETSIPDAYMPLAAPVPPVGDLRLPQMPSGTRGSCGSKNEVTVETANVDSARAIITACSMESLEKDLEETEGKPQPDLELTSSNDLEVEVNKSGESIFLAEEEEDVCPICLEEYDGENPKILTMCEHHFHLACILEWMERSEVCAVCDQEMVLIDDVING